MSSRTPQRRMLSASLVSLLTVLQAQGEEKRNVDLQDLHNVEEIRFESENLFPEGLVYHDKQSAILLSSYGNGNIYSYDLESGTLDLFIEDPVLVGPEAMAIDAKRNRLFVANGDAGVSARSSEKTTNNSSGVAIYDLHSRERTRYVDFSGLHEADSTIANGLTLDDSGNAYVTDSYRPVIYRIDGQSDEASILVGDSRFSGAAFNLNGIAYHPGGFLLALQMGTGLIYRVDIETKQVLGIQIDKSFVGVDGITLINDSQALLTQAYEIDGEVYTLGALHLLESSDNWKTASVVDSTTRFCGNPTNSVVVGDKIYAVNSYIGAYLFQGKDHRDFSFIEISPSD